MSKVDLVKRRRIMQRSMKLGHCICDPRRPCPCDVFTTQGVCPCAGERPKPQNVKNVRLTQLVHNAGCASKIPPTDLEAVLNRLSVSSDPNIICGLPAADDAGVYRLADGLCIVQTVDIMTPCVDDARQMGRICAANCLSDIYAMGGEPKTALSILGFPVETLDGELMYELMAGAQEIFDEAGVALIGGHSIKDEEIKLGFAITGLVDEEKYLKHDTPKVGDVLVLTKKLGCGVLGFASQIGRADDLGLEESSKSMATLNDTAAMVGRKYASACTDVTGFGLFGHLIAMVRSSGMTAKIFAGELPAFSGAIELLGDDVVPGAIERNMEFVAEDIRREDDVSDGAYYLGFDAQTSGGLLLSVPRDKLDEMLTEMKATRCDAWVIGEVTQESEGFIDVVNNSKLQVSSPTTSDTCCCGSEASAKTTESHEGCCADVCDAPPVENSAKDSVKNSAKNFGAFMQSVAVGGEIDAETKELITFALIILGRCEGCFDIHYKKSLKMGITQQQLDEAAWLATGIGGAMVRMFYLEQLKKIDASDNGSCCCG